MSEIVLWLLLPSPGDARALPVGDVSNCQSIVSDAGLAVLNRDQNLCFPIRVSRSKRKTRRIRKMRIAS